MSTPFAPQARVQVLRDEAPRSGGDFVLYWMVMARRTRWNFGLQQAIAHAEALNKPLVVLETLRLDYPFAAPRFHHFMVSGMRDQAERFAPHPGVRYWPFPESVVGGAHQLLVALSKRACLTVTDAFPHYILPAMLAEAQSTLSGRLEVIDGLGLLPLSASGAFPTAFAFRRHLQKTLAPHLEAFPLADPLAQSELPSAAALDFTQEAAQWPPQSPEAWLEPAFLAGLPLDQAVGVVADELGGEKAGSLRAEAFVAAKLARYQEDRNLPGKSGASGLSAYLHFGQLGAHEVVARVLRAEGWTPARLGTETKGKKEGWWGCSPSAEAFLDELVTWREVGLGVAAHLPQHDRYESLPAWARESLAKHASDPRPHRYSEAELEASQTHDPIWNAAQNQLRAEGRIHNYLRMLWGKKVLEWSESPEAAFATLMRLNDRWALDGRDPNTVSGVAWCFGRFDRPWGPERPIFGLIRYMSSDNTARKMDLKPYLARHGKAQQPRLF